MTAPPRDPYEWVSTDSLFGCPVVTDPDMPPNVIKIVPPAPTTAERYAEIQRRTRVIFGRPTPLTGAYAAADAAYRATSTEMRRQRVLDQAVRNWRRKLQWVSHDADMAACPMCLAHVRAEFQHLWKEQV